jgi:hypothetical protein
MEYSLTDSFEDFFILSKFPYFWSRWFWMFGEVLFIAKDSRFLLMSSSFQQPGKVSIPGA